MTISINYGIFHVKANDISKNIDEINKKIEVENNTQILSDSNINKIIEVGALYSEIKNIDDNFYKLTNNMTVLTYKDTKIKDFSYTLDGFNHKSIASSRIKKKFHINLLMNNNAPYSAESLIATFNAYKKVVEPNLLKNFVFEELNLKELDFNNKYRDYQFEIDLEEK